MPLYFARHAKAGSRDGWDGDDLDRPLSGKGWKQAAALADRLEPLVSRHLGALLISSPYVRCVQTLEPLGERLDRKVDVDERLTEGGAFEPVLELLAELPEGSVLSSHGDIVPDVVRALVRRGAVVMGEPDWRKATVWVLDRDADADAIVTATCWAPPR
jgi:phosphohistidine phosphatase SixA